MDGEPETPSGVTRRGLLRRSAAVGVALGVGATGGTVAGRTTSTESGRPAADGTVTVMTRNLYLGADLYRVLGAESRADLRRIVADLFEDIRASAVDARLGAVADEIAATTPDLVGLQEAALVRTQAPSDYDAAPGANASTVRFDFLSRLRAHLDERGLDYAVAAESRNADVEFPAALDDGPTDVRLTDRDAILARRGTVSTADPRTGTFEAAVPVPLASTAAVERGYATVDVTPRGTGASGGDGPTFTFATTHLESVSAAVRERQARELLDRLGGDDRVVLVGDFNSVPGEDLAYDLLAEPFADAAAVSAGTNGSAEDAGEGSADRPGPTCCQGPRLRNADSRLSRRIDLVLTRGGFDPRSAGRVGAAPEDRVRATHDGETVRLWPSDHAGVVAALVPPAATTTPTGTPTATPTRSPTATTATAGTEAGGTPTDSGPEAAATGTTAPGFGIGAGAGALSALLAGALARRRRE